MKKLILLFLIMIILAACKSKSDPYAQEVQFLKGYYKKGKINQRQYKTLRSRAKQKWR